MVDQGQMAFEGKLDRRYCHQKELFKQTISGNAINGPESVFPTYFLSLLIRSTIVGYAYFIYAYAFDS